MPAAIVAAGIGAAGAVGGAVIGSNASKSAAKASQQAADQASALQRETRDMNMQTLAPWQQSGLAANNQINALLGLGVPQGGSPGSVNWAGYVQGNPDALANWNAINGTSDGQPFGGDIAKFGQYHYGADGSRRDLSAYTAGQMGGGNTADAARAAFDLFRNSTGYQFRLGQGMDAVNSGYAGRGMIKSGDAMKAINDYGQGMASAEFGNYMGLLQGQAGTGLSAANAQAGVATNAANNMGNIALQNGSNQANAALLRAQSTGQLVNSLATIGGGLAGQLGGRSGSNAPNYGSALASVGSQLQGPYVPLPRI
jgi:hypothetical protein